MNKLIKYIAIPVFCLLSVASICQTNSTISKGLNIFPFDIDSFDPSELSYLDSIVKPYRIIAAAEYHWSESTLKIEKKFITYLSNRGRLDKIVIERPYAYAYWINEYLDTGDTVILKTITDKYWWADYGRKKSIRYLNYYEFYKWLSAFKNENNYSFDIVGVDLDQVHNGALQIWSIKQFIDLYSLSNSFPKSYPTLKKISSKDKPSLSELKKWHRVFKEELLNQEDLIKSSFGYDYYHFNKFVEGIQHALIYKKKGWKYRERVIAENFKKEIDPTDFVYAQYGHSHILRSGGERLKKGAGFMAEIEKNPLYTGKILSIYLKCKGCKVAGNTLLYWNLFFTEEEYNTLRELIGERSVIVDFRNAAGEFSDIQKYFQLSMFINHR